jgi:hypothetical protein
VLPLTICLDGPSVPVLHPLAGESTRSTQVRSLAVTSLGSVGRSCDEAVKSGRSRLEAAVHRVLTASRGGSVRRSTGRSRTAAVAAGDDDWTRLDDPMGLDAQQPPPPPLISGVRGSSSWQGEDEGEQAAG